MFKLELLLFWFKGSSLFNTVGSAFLVFVVKVIIQLSLKHHLQHLGTFL